MAKTLSEDAAKALARLEDCTTHHRSFCEKIDERHRAYWGVMEIRSKAARWTHKYAPPYVYHIVETTLASMIDEELRFRVRARSKMYEPGEFEQAAAGAKALEILLRWQMEQCRFDEQQRPYVLQNMIAGLTVGKICWQNTTRVRRKLVTEQQLVEDPLTGEPLGYVPRLVEAEEPDTVFDGPMFETCDIRDWFWDEAAISLQRCSVVGHRVWPTFEELKQDEKAGRYQNVDQLKESRDFSADDYSDRDFGVNGAKRTKNRIEVLEIYWRTPTGIKTCTLGNRTVLLKPVRAHPYWHGEYPFIVCSTQPDLFRIPGKSQVEKVMELQEYLWDLGGQTADNLEFINNAIAIVPEGFDYEGWRHEPQAVNEAPDPSSVQMWAPNVIPAQVSLGHMALARGEMQNIAGSYPFSSGTESQTMDQKTATGASIVTSIAQRSIAAQKHQLYLSYQRMGQQFLELDQQYVREPVWVEVVGVDSQPEFEQILPEVLQGQFNFSMQPMTESMMRQEKRAEQLAKSQVLMQWVPVFAAMQMPLNPKEILKDFFEAYDDHDVERFFSAIPQPQAAGAAGGQPDQPAENGQQPLGVTAPQSIDPAVSPSNQVSMSPELMNQRARAMSGGVNNQ